jgi:hypothetical protein
VTTYITHISATLVATDELTGNVSADLSQDNYIVTHTNESYAAAYERVCQFRQGLTTWYETVGYSAFVQIGALPIGTFKVLSVHVVKS